MKTVTSSISFLEDSISGLLTLGKQWRSVLDLMLSACVASGMGDNQASLLPLFGLHSDRQVSLDRKNCSGDSALQKNLLWKTVNFN